ncbi:carboxyl transferase domain-containing protein [Dietzia massiliensis]|uniref:carboxyl transferase domain-containing protein n=1 Tax=Dietzia massiliensis TaxID=2697499 RepID=UPI001BCB1D1E|nr:carboxyl transferase domain-containing protein [Dietzia massiliensis]MBS7547435.1 acetyl-CoA carboxylase carboxyltransferase subunit alpha/beta [Dietzia massiliensis]
MARIGALQILDMVLDDGSFRSWDDAPVRPPQVDAMPGYEEALQRAAEKSGVDESVITGEGTLLGRRVVIIACEFDFLAGSIGIAAAERIVSAIERATAEGLPILASPTSGGTRMQEGTIAFLQMVKISAAVAGHKNAGLPYLVYLRHPTTGGVFASWGSLGHVSVAEPGALIGFLGPRVYEALYDAPFPDGVQVSENLARRGMIDGVLPPEGLRDLTARALRVLCQDPPSDDEPAPPHGPVPEPESDDGLPPDAWDAITRSRRPDRPGARAFLDRVSPDRVPLSGTGQGEDSGSLLLSLVRFRGQSAVVLAQDRDAENEKSPLGPSALRSARRGMRIAAEMGVPLVLLIDTRGAALSREAEEGGLAGEIARSLADLVTLPTPTVSVILGQGTGGAALALLPADRVLCARHGWLAPLPPEGASAILHHETSRAPEVARSQGITSADLLEAGIVDVVVPERPDAADEPEAFCDRMADAVASALLEVRRRPPERRYAERMMRYRELGLALE